MDPGSGLAPESLVGLSVGDALGEGGGFTASGQYILPWTDDTQMAISIVEVLLAGGFIDQDRLAEAFARRYDPRRGYGPGMHRLLSELRHGADWRQLAPGLYPGGSCGNGSAMRVAPLGAFFADAPVEKVAAEAARSAEVTHCYPEGKAGAAAVSIASWLAARSREQTAPPPHLARTFSAL